MIKDLCICIRRSLPPADAEGAGEMFRVTHSFDVEKSRKNEDGIINFKEDFFGKATNLTVSGQLEGELAATAFGDDLYFWSNISCRKF